MKSGVGEKEMRCPKCGWFSLSGSEEVKCRTCGYQLSPGEATKYRLFQMLKAEGRSGK